MSKKTKINQLKTMFDQFKGQPFSSFFAARAAYPDWEGLDLYEFKEAIEYVIKTFEEAFEKDVFSKLSFASINSIFSSISAAHQNCAALLQNKQQAQFQSTLD